MVLLGFLLIVAAIAYFVFKDQIDQYLRGRKSIESKIAAAFKRDFSSDCARCTFYVSHDYSHGYAQSEWLDYYKKVTNGDTMDKTSQEYIDAVAPLINAVVVTEGNVYFRRGLEYIRNYCLPFYPGENDRISLNYFVEPYEYVACDEEIRAQRKRSDAQTSSYEESPYTKESNAARELFMAKQRYERAVSQHNKFKDTTLASMYETREKEAYAAMLSAQIKYDNSKVK